MNRTSAPAPTTTCTRRRGPEIFFKSLPAQGGRVRASRRHPAGRALVGARARAGAGHQLRRPHRRLLDRQRHELARHRGREPAVSAAGQDLLAIVRHRTLDRRRADRAGRARSGRYGSRFAATARVVFDGETRIDQLKRTFGELVEHLFRSQAFPTGAVLLTGAGIVPDDTFTLNAGDARAHHDLGHRHARESGRRGLNEQSDDRVSRRFWR